MKGIKPQRLGMLHRVVEHERRCTLVVTVFTYTPLDQPRALLPEQLMWMEVAERLPRGLLDEGFPKPCGEVLVTGSARAPGGDPISGLMARVQVRRGDDDLIDKKLAVFGTRHWGMVGASDPAPFTEVPIDWTHAFGGEGYDNNPDGMGFGVVESEAGEVHPLPQVEDPKALVTSRSDRPPPASFGPYPIEWPQRFAHMGKRYDKKWLKTRYPGPAEDFDAHFYNAAPVNQRIDGFFQGDETFALEGMHADHPRLEGTLQPLRVRAFVTQREETDDGHDDTFRAVDTRLDTLHFLPDLGRMVSVYRGTIDVADDDADDIVHMMIAAEDPDHPRPLEHYQEVLAKRLDKDKAALESLRDADLMPAAERGWSVHADAGEIGERLRTTSAKLDHAERGRARGDATRQAAMNDAGFDAEPIKAPPSHLRDPYDIDALIDHLEEAKKLEAELKAELEEKRVDPEVESRAAFEDAGLDYDEEVRKANEGREDALSYSADDHLAMMEDMARVARQAGSPNLALERDLADEDYRASLKVIEERVHSAVLHSAHLMPDLGPVADDEAKRLRVLVQAAKDGEESLAGRRLRGADLSGMDLRDIDLSGAILIEANLRDTLLMGANLTEAVLVRAELVGTDLTDADLSRANLGSSRLVDANLSGATLHETVFMRSTLERVSMVGADLDTPNFIESTFANVDFSNSRGKTPIFIDADLRRVTFTGIHWELARFLKVDVRGIDFTGVDLRQAQFSCATVDGACFANANLEGAFFVYKTSCVGCDFTGATLKRANLNGTPCRNSSFIQADLDSAAIVKTDLRGSRMAAISGRNLMAMRADLRDVDLRGADLLQAIMQKARLEGTLLTGANLVRSDLSLVRKDDATDLSEARLEDARTVPEYEAPAPRATP